MPPRTTVHYISDTSAEEYGAKSAPRDDGSADEVSSKALLKSIWISGNLPTYFAK